MDYGPSVALLVVDVQNDFASPQGSLAVDGAESAISFINEQIADAHQAGAVVVYTQDWHPETTPHFEKDGGIWPVHCVGGTEGAEFHPALDVVGDAIAIKKGVGGEDGYSAFNIRDPQSGEVNPTGLAEQLRGRGVTTTAVLGLALDYCVKDTVIDSVGEGFDTTLLADGTRAVNLRPGDGSRAAVDMARSGATVE